jgi:predicted alpha/beta superfamily hydrolase
MQQTLFTLNQTKCLMMGSASPQWVLIQPMDEHDSNAKKEEYRVIESSTSVPFALVGFLVDDWREELVPWTAPPVFGRKPFGDGAAQTLTFIEKDLLPEVHGRLSLSTSSRFLLGGYSLAGLFALWAGYQSDAFVGICAASPSVWYPRWLEYAEANRMKSQAVYLSLGDKEGKTKNTRVASVEQCIQQQSQLLDQNGITHTLEWNPGGHFVDAGKRTGKGFAWLMNNIEIEE